MSYGKLNIWIRELNCCPKNVWKVELVVKTCCGEYLVDFNPDVIDKLKEAYPGYDVRRGARDNETTINIRNKQIKHIEVDVPPGCYIVRAWVCSDNLWSDRVMVIVGCGQEGCVNLIVPPREGCIRDVVLPLGRAILNMRLQPEKARAAFEVLLAAGHIPREAILKEISDLTKELKESDVKEARQYLEGFELTAKIVKGIRPEQE